MGFGRALLYLDLFAVLFCAVAVESKNCPPPNMVYSRTPVCRDDYDCKQGKLCCPNGTGFKSCAEPVRGGAAADDKYKAYQSRSRKYCDQCSPFQKCGTDKYGRHSCK